MSRRPTGFDLIKLCTGVSRELGLHSDCISAVCQTFANARQATFPRTPRFRSARRNLDWIPVSRLHRAATLNGGLFTFQKRKYRLWFPRPLPDAGKPKSWNFSADARGRWYVNIQVELPEAAKREVHSEIGVDLGLKTLAALSNGDKIEMPAFYRRSEAELARLQRFGLTNRARSLAAKVANQRKHFLHVQSTKLVETFDRIVVGDVNASKLAKTKMSKSVLDAGWSAFRSMLQYKSIATGAETIIVNEHMTSQTCSECGGLPSSRPKGIAGLGMRHWTCSDCGISHDRDTNAARNILRVGAERRAPVVEILAV